ncbi:MAG: non-histone chromosomal MC1 family protein [archaeon]
MAKKRKSRAKKTYVLRNKSKDTDRVFTGSSPRQAALKAATRGVADIQLRERGRRNADKTYSVHVFKGSRKMVSAPENRPSWLPAKVRKPVVKKVKVLRLKKI